VAKKKAAKKKAPNSLAPNLKKLMNSRDIVKYFVEGRKISDAVKILLVPNAAKYGRLDCLKYLVEESKVPLNHWEYVASARHYEQPDCLNYLLEKGCPEPTDEEYVNFIEHMRAIESPEENIFD